MKITVKVGSKGQARLIKYMALKLSMRSDRNSRKWTQCDREYLFKRLLEEVEELRGTTGGGELAWAEAADIANFAAMIADIQPSANSGENDD